MVYCWANVANSKPTLGQRLMFAVNAEHGLVDDPGDLPCNRRPSSAEKMILACLLWAYATKLLYSSSDGVILSRLISDNL